MATHLTRVQVESQIILAFAYDRERIIYRLLDALRTDPVLKVYSPLPEERVPFGPADVSKSAQQAVSYWTFKAQRVGASSSADGDFYLWRIVADGGQYGDVVVWTGLRRRY